MKTKKITGVATAALLASVAVPVTNNLANIQTSYTAKAVTGQQQAFLNTAIPNAEAASARYGTYTSVMLAQSILESGWGASLLATQANNLFGMKGSYNGQTYYTNTSEWASGTGYYNINAGFRKYPSWAASFEDNGYKLRTGTTDNPSRYRMAWIENAANYQVATQGLKDGGYATSPTYPQSLNRVISSYGLNQYDPSVDTTTKTMRVLSNGTVYSGPADSSVVSATGNITAGQVVTVDKTVTYKNGLSYMHISNGWINGSLLTGSSTQATTTEKAGTTTDAGNAAIKVVYTSAIAEWKNPGSGVVGYLQKGTTQTVVGKIQVNGAWWYKLSSGNWVPGEYVYVTGASRIPTIDNNVVNQNTKVKIKYISGYSIAVWSNPAIGTTGQYLKDGTEVQTIGYTTANGKKWYKLANNTWIPAEYTEVVSSSTVVTNITNESNTVAINYPHYSIAVWSEPGRNSTGKYLSDGTKVQTVGYTTVNGKKWYKLADNTWIPAEYTEVVSSSTVV
ncbi:glucosaminidase domain-containing protein, partial [Lactobacillus jensenii]|uniref:glucosaminidase domain-containing protein n=1 Tax=Lactobacillus jensenii TaxID=109790 RepID=UPI001F0975DE